MAGPTTVSAALSHSLQTNHRVGMVRPGVSRCPPVQGKI